MKLRIGKTYIEVARIKEPKIDFSGYTAQEGVYDYETEECRNQMRTADFPAHRIRVTQEQYDAIMERLDEPAQEVPGLTALLDAVSDTTGLSPERIKELGGVDG